MSSWNGLTLNLAVGNSYATDFIATENPLSESGHWINGKTTGLDWSDCASVSGVAYGTQPAHADFVTDDSTCVLTGTWGRNQMAQATVFVNPPFYFDNNEVELRLNTTISPHFITGYEITWGNSGYVIIVRWEMDPTFSYSILSWVDSPGLIHGATFKATNVNGRITAYVNGAEITHATDTMYTAGSPGIGFFRSRKLKASVGSNEPQPARPTARTPSAIVPVTFRRKLPMTFGSLSPSPRRAEEARQPACRYGCACSAAFAHRW